MTEQQQLARGKNVMLSFLEKRLSVPRIYLDADWQTGRVDLLAIDRDGSGDVHVVLAYLRPLYDAELPDVAEDKERLRGVMERLSTIRAQYKYALGVGTSKAWQVFGDHPAQEFSEASFSPDGLGRTGVAFAAPDVNGSMTLNLVILPERFRAFVSQAADEFVSKHAADWELRA